MSPDQLQRVELIDELFEGHISLERHGEAVKPWRIPVDQMELYPPDTMTGRAEMPAGVRIRFRSATGAVSMSVEVGEPGGRFDCLINGVRAESVHVENGEALVVFNGLDSREKLVEIYLPQTCPVSIRSLHVENGVAVDSVRDNRVRWVTYGSSITQCASADGPSETWPALVARSFNYNLTCLGFGGNCHLEPMVARLIRDLPADVISLCLGINVYGASSLGPRTFKAAVIGLIQIIREKHPTTPIAVISPIASPPRETVENAVGFTLQGMRAEVRDAVDRLQRLGDQHLVYIDGLEIMNVDDANTYMPDELHPDAQGYRLMAERIKRHVFGKPLFASANSSGEERLGS